MEKLLKIKNKKTVSVIFITVVSIVIFAFSVELRKQYFGQLSEGHHNWVTGHSLLILKNWYHDNPVKYFFGMPFYPDSIEFLNQNEREFYYSFPNGFIWPIYTLSSLVKKEPTVSMVMKYNLFCQLIISISLSLSIYFLLIRKHDNFISTMLSLPPAILTTLLPGPLYFFQNTYFTQEAVLLPYAIFLLTESYLFYSKGKNRFILRLFQSLTVLFGLLTDWLFVFITIVSFIINIFLYKKKTIAKIITSNLHLVVPSIIFLVFYIVQLKYLGGLKQILTNIMFRTGISETGKVYISNFIKKFWLNFYVENFGVLGLIIIIITIVFLLGIISIKIYKKKLIELKDYYPFILLTFIPCLLEIYVLKNHSSIHDFTALKLVIPLATIPFSIIPIILIENIKIRKIKLLIPILFLLLSGFYIKLVGPKYHNLFPKNNPSYYLIGDLISKNSNYNDIYFSPNYDVSKVPPQQISMTYKRVNLIQNINDIEKFLKDKNLINNKEVNIKILLIGKNQFEPSLKILAEMLKTNTKLNINDSNIDDIIREIGTHTEFYSTNSKFYSQNIDYLKSLDDKNIYILEIKPSDFIKLKDDINKSIYTSITKLEYKGDTKSLLDLITYYKNYLTQEKLQEINNKIKRINNIKDKTTLIDFSLKKKDKNQQKFSISLTYFSKSMEKDWSIYLRFYQSNKIYKINTFNFKPDLPTSRWTNDQIFTIEKELTLEPNIYNIETGFEDGINYYENNYLVKYQTIY